MKISNVTYGSVVTQDFLHISGGLRGRKTSRGWLIGPLPQISGSDTIGPFSDEMISSTCSILGVSLIGGDEICWPEKKLEARIWTPLLGPPKLTHSPIDLWNWISQSAIDASNELYSSLAQNVSISLHAAGIRIRDASDLYHQQLVAALERKQKPGLRFSNIRLTDLHLAFHSIFSELGSARDYLAAIAAYHVNAPENIDSLARLSSWAKKAKNLQTNSDPIFKAILDGSANGWLEEIGMYRNTLLHREPLATNEHARFLRLSETTTPLGKFSVIEMRVPDVTNVSNTVDALVKCTQLHGALMRFAHSAVAASKFPAEPKLLTVE